MNIEAIKTNKEANQNKKKKVENTKKNEKQALNSTLQGVLVNTHLRNSSSNKFSFDDIQDSLLINDSEKYYSSPEKKEQNRNNESAFDMKKAMIPLVAGSAMLAGGCFLLSAFLKKSSGNLLTTKSFEQLPDLAINMNIKEEPQFAIYKAIRDPNYKNILGATAVFLMSGITIACKNFVDGAKEIWIKKRNADIEKNLQENLISVERDAFSGKLKVVNDMMNQNIKYFDEVINSKPDTPMPEFSSSKHEKSMTSRIFEPFSASFKGEADKKTEEAIKNSNDEVKEQNDKAKAEKIKNLKYAAMVTGIIAGGVILGKLSFSNLRKTMQNSQTFANNFTENTINAIENISQKGDAKDLPGIIELMKSICAKPEYIKEVGKKYNLGEAEVKKIIEAVEESKKTIFADAPTALGGIPKKVQYYCYIDEPRGHLYNWILNPENKFTKYIFYTFTMSSAIGYLFKQGMDALKEVTVSKENAKTDLDLKKRLVDVEIENFKAKKESAINPLTDNFTKQANSGKKSKEELKQLADNILTEIKNGPPYVYN